MIAGASAAGLVVTFRLRTRLRRSTVDVLLACSGAILGLGAALLVDGATGVEMALAALVCAGLGPVHVHLLFAGGGPFRT